MKQEKLKIKNKIDDEIYWDLVDRIDAKNKGKIWILKEKNLK